MPVGDLKSWSVNPFSGTVKNNKLFGRGASDMKGSIACFVAALSQFKKVKPKFKGSISLLITGDEEAIAIKTMEKISIKKNKDKITLKFTSKSFLQQQVRSMVGCIKYLGEDKWNLDTFKQSFKSKNRIRCAPPAPACGLYLAKNKY